MEQKKKFVETKIVVCLFNPEDVITSSGDAANEQGMDIGNDNNFWTDGGNF